MQGKGIPPSMIGLQQPAVASASASDAAPLQASASPPDFATAVNRLAGCLQPVFQRVAAEAGEDLSDPAVMGDVVAAAQVIAELILRCVHDGHVDFTPLPPDSLTVVAAMRRDALAVIDDYAGGIVDFSVPWEIRQCAEYNPTELAGHLDAVASKLEYLALPTPAGDVVVMDLQNLRREDLHLVVQCESGSTVTLLVDHGVGMPRFPAIDTPRSLQRRADDPVLAGASRVVWLNEGQEVGRMKFMTTAGAAYHHTALASSDRLRDAKAQATTASINLNAHATAWGRLIMCAPLAIWMLRKWHDERISREVGVPHPRVDGKHAALHGMDRVGAISARLPPEVIRQSDAWWMPGGWTPCLATGVGQSLVMTMRNDRAGTERSFACWTPGLTGDVSHGMALRVRVKTEQGKTVYAVRVYDPNGTATWARKVYKSLNELQKLSLAEFLRPSVLADYVRPQAPVIAIKEWPGTPGPGEAESPRNPVPEALRDTPEYVWAASVCGPDCLAEAVKRAAQEPTATAERLNPLFNRFTLLQTMLYCKDTACLRAFGRAIADAPALQSATRASLAMRFIGEIIDHPATPVVAAAGLAPLVRCVGAGQFVRQLLASKRPEADRVALFDEVLGSPDERTRIEVCAALAAAFPDSNDDRRRWAQALRVESPDFPSGDAHQKQAFDGLLAHLPPQLARIVADFDAPESPPVQAEAQAQAQPPPGADPGVSLPKP